MTHPHQFGILASSTTKNPAMLQASFIESDAF